MGVYTINAAIDGHATVLATVDTAAMALAKVRSALDEYARVWVTDELDRDVDVAQLREIVDRGKASQLRSG
jgi:hypothetical protein